MVGLLESSGLAPVRKGGGVVERILQCGLLQRGLLFALFAVHCSLRFSGLSWNIEHHAAFPTQDVPTYHVDEDFLVEGMRSDFRLFSGYSLLVDGPLSANLMYLPLAMIGERAPDRFSARNALLVGRAISAAADCLAFPVLWLLLATLGATPWAALFGVAVITFGPNEVFNAHFARSHTLANLLQLSVLLATARMLLAIGRIQRALWFGAAVLLTLLAASARYPLLTLGILPSAAAVSLLLRADRRSELGLELKALGLTGFTALVVGLLLGFGFHPVRIFQNAFAYQSKFGQLNWHDISGIARSAQTKLISVFRFAGGGARLILLLAAPLIFFGARRESKPDVARFLGAGLALWAGLYLILWAKFSVPWQRYAIPLSSCLVVLGVVGFTRGSVWAEHLIAPRPLRLVSVVGTVALLTSPAYLCGLMLYHFVDDLTHPLYQVGLALRSEPRRQIFINNWWSWNRPLFHILPSERFEVHLVPSLEAACALARDGDLVFDLVFEPLRGRCASAELTPIFHASNLGPPGYPYPADHLSPYTGSAADTVDYHYLFQDVTLSRLSLNSGPEIR